MFISVYRNQILLPYTTITPPSHHHHTTSHHHHHHPPHPPPATCRQAKGGGSCFLPIESAVFGVVFGNPRTVKKLRKNTYVLTPHFLSKKLEQIITKWSKIGHFVRVFGEFKIVEFVIPWGLRFIACLWSLILSLFVVAGHSLEVAWSFWCQPALA